MDVVGVAGLVLSALGVGLSIVALIQAGRAKTAVTKAIARGVDQGLRDDARVLLSKLQDARDAAMGRKQGASRLSSAGRSVSGDLRALQIAQTGLATVVVQSDTRLELSFRNAASQLDDALAAINAAGSRDGWADALQVLHGIIPKVDVLQRGLGTKAVELQS